MRSGQVSSIPMRFDRRVTTEPQGFAAPAAPDGANAQRELTVFLDRDGVLVRDRPDYVKNWSEVEIVPGSHDLERCRSEASLGARGGLHVVSMGTQRRSEEHTSELQ